MLLSNGAAAFLRNNVRGCQCRRRYPIASPSPETVWGWFRCWRLGSLLCLFHEPQDARNRMPELWEDGRGNPPSDPIRDFSAARPLPALRTVRNEVESVTMPWAETQAFLLLEKNLALPYKPA